MSRPLLLSFVLLAGCGGGAAPPAARRPNVLLVTLDTTRPDYFSTYGGQHGKTPALDSLAARGARFDLALSTSGLTPVSHASILTGTYQDRHGLRVLSALSGDRLPADRETLATRFARAGYTTGAALSSFPVSSWFGLERGFETWDSMEGELQQKKGKEGWDMNALQRRSDDTVEVALAFAAGAERPWFLWVHLWDPHDAVLLPPDEFLEGLTPNERGRWPRDPVYAREVRYMDTQLGRLLDGLEAAHADDELIVAVTADHGEGLDDGKARHGWTRHRIVYQEQVHVPLVVATPGGTQGLTIPAVVSTVDVAATLLDYTGVPYDPGELDGRTLRPLLEGREDPPRVAYADQLNGYDENAGIAARRPQAAFLYALVEWPWKVIYRPHMTRRSELFHLGEDPLELECRLEERPEVARRLLQMLAERDPWVTRPFSDMGDGAGDASDALASLGYGGDEDGDAEEAVGELIWTWACFTHSTSGGEPRGRCSECGDRLLPRTSWR